MSPRSARLAEISVLQSSQCDLGRQQHALFQVPRRMRVGSGVRIVSDHHDCFMKVFVKPLKDFEHFRSRMAIEVAGRLVREQ